MSEKLYNFTDRLLQQNQKIIVYYFLYIFHS